VFLAGCLVLCLPLGAVELRPEPIQTQLRSSLAASSSIGVGGTMTLGGVYDTRKSPEASEQDGYGRKSAFKAAFFSALLPGMGQYYCGHRKTARYFWAAEAASWLGLVAYRTYGGWKEDDYIRFGREKAGVRLENKPDWFVDYVSYYDNIDQYNQFGRAIDRERPYLENTSENYWFWKSTSDKNAFRDLKNRSREAYRRSDFMIGAMIVNRMVSAIHAVRIAGRTGKRLDDLVDLDHPAKLDYRVEVNPFSDHIQLGVTLFTRF